MRPAKLSAVVSQDGTQRLIVFLIKGKYVVVGQSGGTFWLFLCVEEAKGIRTVGIHADMNIDLPYAFQTAHKHGILTQKFPRSG